MQLYDDLELIQEKNGYIPITEAEALGKKYGKSAAEILGTASFYDFFTLKKTECKKRIENIYPLRKAGPLLLENNAEAAMKSIESLSPSEIISAVGAANLYGRSGGGFPTAKKWEITASVKSESKYVICNADEGEPGTGKDRIILTKVPKTVIAGLAAAAKAVGAKEAIIYLRGEYSDLLEHIQSAINETAPQWLHIELMTGHGAYVCGEETALINSAEGKRGETRTKPPFPGVSGFSGKPTVVNNVETLCCVSYILANSPEKFASIGDKKFPGSKLYTVFGNVRNPGIYEMETGVSPADLINEAGGTTGELKALLIGGGSGTFVKPEAISVRLTPADCSENGFSPGTGSVRVICNEDLLEILLKLEDFFRNESCGICVPCRIGLQRIYIITEKFRSGKAYDGDLALLKETLAFVKASARCGMAKAAVVPCETLINNFPEVFK